MDRIGTIALRGLVPALLLPVATAAAAIVGGMLHPSAGDMGGGIVVLVIVVYLFVLLGSMTLNAWLLLRNPATFTTRALPDRIAALLIALWAVLVVWSVLLVFGVLDTVWVVLGAANALLSVIICALAVARRRDATPRVAESTLSRAATAAALTYVVAAILALAYTAVASVITPGFATGGAPLGGPETWTLLVLGLPWSWPLYLASFLGQVILIPNGPILYYLAPVVTAISVVANVALAAVLLWWPSGRVAVVNWFFRLRGAPGTASHDG